MRRPFVFLLPVLLGQCVDGSMPPLIRPGINQAIMIASTPVALDAANPARRRVGALTLEGAWHLTSTTRGFGGLSALDVHGNQITAMGDGGTIVRFRLGRFGNASNASIVRLPDRCGRVLRKTDNDTEALTHDAGRRHWWVAYEWRNAVCKANGDFTRGETVGYPRAIQRWPRKQGAESFVRLADGRFLAIAEAVSDNGIAQAVLFDRDPTDPAVRAIALGYRPPSGFKPTDMAQLPDGRLLILNRRFSMWSLFVGELVLLPALAAQPSGVMRGRTIARFQPPILADNFEGLSVTIENGRPVIWIISDDNFMRWQRTLLLKFALN